VFSLSLVVAAAVSMVVVAAAQAASLPLLQYQSLLKLL
jgi:hypothetical protein